MPNFTQEIPTDIAETLLPNVENGYAVPGSPRYPGDGSSRYFVVANGLLYLRRTGEGTFPEAKLSVVSAQPDSGKPRVEDIFLRVDNIDPSDCEDGVFLPSFSKIQTTWLSGVLDHPDGRMHNRGIRADVVAPIYRRSHLARTIGPGLLRSAVHGNDCLVAPFAISQVIKKFGKPYKPEPSQPNVQSGSVGRSRGALVIVGDPFRRRVRS